MYFARLSVWKFEKGQREKGLKVLNDSISNVARAAKGYRGFMQLLSQEAAEDAIIITLWESERARDDSAKGVFKDAVKTLEQFVDREPNVSNFKLSDAEVRV